MQLYLIFKGSEIALQYYYCETQLNMLKEKWERMIFNC